MAKSTLEKEADSAIPMKAEKMFEHYLYRIGLRKSIMNPVQYIEMKKSFYAALSNMIISINNCKSDDSTIHFLEQMNQDCTKFWNNQK